MSLDVVKQWSLRRTYQLEYVLSKAFSNFGHISVVYVVLTYLVRWQISVAIVGPQRRRLADSADHRAVGRRLVVWHRRDKLVRVLERLLEPLYVDSREGRNLVRSAAAVVRRVDTLQVVGAASVSARQRTADVYIASIGCRTTADVRLRREPVGLRLALALRLRQQRDRHLMHQGVSDVNPQNFPSPSGGHTVIVRRTWHDIVLIQTKWPNVGIVSQTIFQYKHSHIVVQRRRLIRRVVDYILNPNYLERLRLGIYSQAPLSALDHNVAWVQPINTIGSGHDGRLRDDGTTAQQRLVRFQDHHRLPRELTESGVPRSSTAWLSVVIPRGTLCAGLLLERLELGVSAVYKLKSSGGESLVAGVAGCRLLLSNGRGRLRGSSGCYSTVVLGLGLGVLRLTSTSDLVGSVGLGGRDTAWRSENRFVGLGALNTVTISVTVSAVSVRFVRSIVKGKQLRVVQTEHTDWPRVNVVRIATAHSSETAVGAAALRNGDTEQFLFGRQDNGSLRDDTG